MNRLELGAIFFFYVYDECDLYMSHGTIILFNISLLNLSELSPSWVLNVTEILESLILTKGVKRQPVKGQPSPNSIQVLGIDY